MDGPSPKFESEFFNLCHSCVLVTLMTMDSPTPLVNSPTPLANLLTTSVNLLCQHQVLLHKLWPKTKDNCHRVDLWCHRVDLSVKWLGTAIINVPYHLYTLNFLNTLISHQMARCWVFSAASASIHRRWHQPAVAIPPLFCGRKTATRSGHSNRIDQRNAWVRLHHRGWGPSWGTPTDQEHRPRRCRGKGWSAKNGWCSEKGQWHVCVD